MERAVFALVIFGSKVGAQETSRVDEAERLIRDLRSDDEDVDTVWKTHGRWVLPSLLAALRDGTNQSSQARSIFILKSILNVAPAIREALRHNKDRKDAEFDDNCCMVLHEQGRSEELRRIAQNEQVSARARETAVRLLRQ